MVIALLVIGILFACWHFSDGWGKSGGLFAFLLVISLPATGSAEWTDAQVLVMLERSAEQSQHLENLTAILGYGVGLLAAFSLLYRIRLK